MSGIQLFLSAVTDEFQSYREVLRGLLKRPNVDIHVQEDFIATGTETLDKLDRYIASCDGVIHLVGDMTGAWANPATLESVKARYPDLTERLPSIKASIETSDPPLSYTQWEALLAIYHRKVLIIGVPQVDAPRDAKYRIEIDHQASQHAHLQRLRGLGHYQEIVFENANQLAVEVLRSSVLDLLAKAGAGARTKPITLPYSSIGPLFKGRDEFLTDLRNATHRPEGSHATTIRTKVIRGLGGVGKTRLVVEYAWQYQAAHSALLFVFGNTPADLRGNLAALVKPMALNLPEQESKEEDVRIAAVCRWLHQNPGWLLIVDSVDTHDAATEVEKLAAGLRGGDLFITSRRANWSAAVDCRELGLLPEHAAEAFLLERTETRRRGAEDDPLQARLLAQELGNLALALEQAAAYIAVRRLSFAEYFVDWYSNRLKVMEWYDPQLTNYPMCLAITWQTSVDQIGEAALRLLCFAAWLAPDPIPEMLLETDFPGETNSRGIWRDALGELEAHSLVTRGQNSPIFTVHRLVQDLTRRSLNDDDSKLSLALTLNWIDSAFVGDAENVDSLSTLDLLIPHARAVVRSADEFGILTPTVRLMDQLGRMLIARARFSEAEPLVRRTCEIVEKKLTADHPEIGITINNLGSLYEAQGHLSEAESLYQRCLLHYERSLPSDHPLVGTTLNNLANLYVTQGRYGEAEPLYRRSLAIAEKGPVSDNVSTGHTLSNLGWLYVEQGRYSEAEPLLNRALEIKEKTFGPDHPDTAATLDHLASLYRAQSRFRDAATMYQRALAIREMTLGSDHPLVGNTLSNLAGLLVAQNRTAEAIPLYQRSLNIHEKVVGVDNPDFASVLSNVAVAYANEGRYDEAVPLVQRSLEVTRKALGPDHPDVGLSLLNLGEIFRAQNHTAEAEAATRQGILIIEKALGPKHLLISKGLQTLAAIYYDEGRYREAEPLLRRCHTIREKSLGEQHPDLASTLNSLGLLFARKGRYAKGVRLMRRSLRILFNIKGQIGRSPPYLQKAIANYRGILAEMGKSQFEIDEAITALEQESSSAAPGS